jgi:O-antigen ligase
MVLKPRYALYIFIFLYPLIPKYINIEIIKNSVYITYQSAMILILLSFTILIYLISDIKLKQLTIVKEKYLFYSLFLFFFIKLLTTVFFSTDISGGIISIIYYLLDSLVVLLLLSFYITDDKKLTVLLYTLFYSYLFVLIISFVEKAYGGNIFVDFANVNYSFYSDILAGKSRNEEYRLMGAFSNTLLLSGYLAILLPLVLASTKIFNSTIIFIMASLTLLWTYSRTSFLLLFIFVLISVVSSIYTLISQRLKNVFRKLLFFFLALGFIVFIANINTIFEILLSSAQGTSEKASLVSRYNQFVNLNNVITGNIFLGNGTTRSLVSSNEELTTIDNFYLRQFIETGILGLSLYLLFLFLIIKSAIKAFKNDLSERDHVILYASLVSFILFLIDLMLTSIPGHHIYLYIITYIIIFISSKYYRLSKNSSRRRVIENSIST